jgi:hypothetical protein
LLLSTAALASGVVTADEVFLVGGGRIIGEVVEQSANAVVVDVGPGRVTLPASRVSRIASGRSALAVYRSRAARLGPADAAGWLELGLWARDSDLLTLAREAFERVLAADPANEAAHRALGHVRLSGQWMTESESYRARGYVDFEGSWMTPAQARLLADQRAVEAEARRADREAAAREREAEARARTAEAEAVRAAAEAQAAQSSGIPYGWVFGPGYGPFDPYGGVVMPVAPHGGARHGHRTRRGDHARVKPPQRLQMPHPPVERPGPPARPVRAGGVKVARPNAPNALSS